MQFAVLGWLPALSRGDYRLELSFSLPEAHAFREKALYAASISCAGTLGTLPALASCFCKMACET